MGVVKRQSIKFTVVSIVGTLLGAASVLFIYPLNDALYGYASWLFSTAALLVPITTLGVPAIIVRFFHQYQEKSQKELFRLVSGLYLAAFSIFLVLYALLSRPLFSVLEGYGYKVNTLIDNEFWLLGLAFLFGLVRILYNFSMTKKRIAIPQLLENVGYKVFLPLAFLFLIYTSLDTIYINYLIGGFFIFLVLAMFAYDIRIKALLPGIPRWFRSDEPKQEMLSFSLFGSLNGIGNLLAMRLDLVMIPFILSMEQNGIYAKLIVIVNILSMPLKSVINITNPILSEHWHHDRKSEITKLYKQASNNLFFIGSLFFLVIYFSFPHLVEISSRPESFGPYLIIFTLLGVGKLADLLGSINSGIIIFSKRYRVHLYAILAMAIVNLILNIILIKAHGIIGAAFATAISLITFNLIKSIYIKTQFGIRFYTSGLVKTVILGSIAFGIMSVLPLTDNPYMNIVIVGSVLSIIYLIGGIGLAISKEVNETLYDVFKKMRQIIS